MCPPYLKRISQPSYSTQSTRLNNGKLSLYFSTKFSSDFTTLRKQAERSHIQGRQCSYKAEILHKRVLVLKNKVSPKAKYKKQFFYREGR